MSAVNRLNFALRRRCRAGLEVACRTRAVLPLVLAWVAGTAAWVAVGGLAVAGDAAPFAGADLALGQKLIREHRCSECHAQRFGDDGNAVYRPKGRINTPAALRSMVQRCDAELGLQMFPEDVDAVAAVLNQQHYHFR